MRHLGLLLATVIAVATPTPASSQEAPKDKEDTVLTYYGLREYETRPDVSDHDKEEQWRAFIARTKEQLKYAHKAVEFWKDAAKLRLIEAAQKADKDDAVSPADKIAAWKKLIDAHPKIKEAKAGRQRIGHWTQVETKRLVNAAKELERAGATKVERIRAWRKVQKQAKGADSKSAAKKIDALESQLFSEAKSLDAIARVDAKTKIAVWKDVLAAEPSKARRAYAEKRIKVLESAAH